MALTIAAPVCNSNAPGAGKDSSPATQSNGLNWNKVHCYAEKTTSSHEPIPENNAALFAPAVL